MQQRNEQLGEETLTEESLWEQNQIGDEWLQRRRAVATA